MSLFRFPLIASALLLATAPGLAAPPTFPAASHIGLVPPPDFVASAGFAGFQHTEKQARIIIAELPAFAYENLVQQAEQQKTGALKREEVSLESGATGILFSGVDESAQGPVLKWTLLTRDKQVTALISAMVPDAIKEAMPEPAVRAALLSTTVREKVPVEEQLSVLPFSMHDLAGLRIVRVQPGTAAMLTDGPKDSADPAEQPLLIVSIGPMQQAPAGAERDGFARRAFAELPGIKEVRITRAEPLRVAGAQGYEIVAEGKETESGNDVHAVQWLRFGTGTVLRIVGVSRKDAWDRDFKRFRAVRDGIGPR
jgi:hypothetical protein